VSVDLNQGTPLQLETAKRGTFISSKGVCRIPCADTDLPAHVFDNSELSKSLISVSDITATGIEVRMDTHGTRLYRDDVLLSHHPKSVDSKLYPFANAAHDPPLTAGTAAAALSHKSDKDIVLWAHTCFGSPPATTVIVKLSSTESDRYKASLFVPRNPW